MARSLLPVAVGLVGCIWPLSPALACDPAVARAEASAAWQALRELRSQDFFDAADEISPCPGLDGAERAELLRLQGASAAPRIHLDLAHVIEALPRCCATLRFTNK